MERKSGNTLRKTFIKNCITEKKAFSLYLTWIGFSFVWAFTLLQWIFGRNPLDSKFVHVYLVMDVVNGALQMHCVTRHGLQSWPETRNWPLDSNYRLLSNWQWDIWHPDIFSKLMKNVFIDCEIYLEWKITKIFLILQCVSKSFLKCWCGVSQ